MPIIIDFDSLQQQWQAQLSVAPQAAQQSSMPATLQHRLARQRRRIWISNILTTIGFAAVYVVLYRVYTAFHVGRSLFFTGSIAAMFLLLTVYLGVIWRNITMRPPDPSQPTTRYVLAQVRMLRWRRRVITFYSPAYALLLWVAVMCYGFDVTAGQGPLFTWGYAAAVTVYMVLIQWLAYRFKMRKQLSILDELITELDTMNRHFDGGE